MGPGAPGLRGPGAGSGGRTRTPNDRARTCCVADYTTPERAGTSLPGCGAGDDPVHAGLGAISHDAGDGDGDRLATHADEGVEAPDGAGAGRRRVPVQVELAGDAADPQGVERIGDEQHLDDA